MEISSSTIISSLYTMRTLLLLFFFIFFIVIRADDLEKYRPLREKCQRAPSSTDCVTLKNKFLDLIRKCQSIVSPQQLVICQEVKVKLCNIFPSTCTPTPTAKPTSATTKRKVTKKKLVTTISTTTMKAIVSTSSSLSDEEFVQVPVDPEALRTRGEYCVRHGKEKKCQELLSNLKSTYSTCGKKKVEVKPERIDCHSFQTHLCKAFPKFPPCLKKTTA